VRRRPLARFVLCFFALTLPLTWLWMEWGRDHYARFLIGLAEQIFEIGRSGSAARGSAAGARFVSVVPFVVLMAVTPGLSWRRRLLGTLAGLAFLVAVHLCLLLLVDAVEAQYGRGRRSIKRFFPFLIVADGVPLLLWLILARDFLASAIPGFAEEPPSRQAER
jgi:hypothetical protein